MSSLAVFSTECGSIPTQANAPMTAAQRSCLLHILRNCASALEGLTLFLEESNRDATCDELHGCLRGVVRALTSMDDSLQRGSFCALAKEDCVFVSPFVGCRGEPK